MGDINWRWDKGVASGKEIWFEVLRKINTGIAGIPTPPKWIWGGTRLTIYKKQIQDIVGQINKLSNTKLDEALGVIRREVDEVLDELDRIIRGGEPQLATDITSGKYSSGNIQRVITQLRSAKNAEQFGEALAELSRPNRLIRRGKVANDSLVIIGAKEGTGYSLGTTKIDPAPVPDAYVLYKGVDCKTYIEEVKNTATALRQKLNESPKQLERLGKWLKKDPENRAMK